MNIVARYLMYITTYCLKVCQTGRRPDEPLGVWDVPSLQEREYEGPPELAKHQPRWSCEVCGHDKFVRCNADTRSPHPFDRRCVRCRAVYVRPLKLCDGMPRATWDEWELYGGQELRTLREVA